MAGKITSRKEFMGEQRNKRISEADALAEAEKMLDALKKEKNPNQDGDTAGEETKQADAKETDAKKTRTKVGKAKVRSAKYKKSLTLVDRNKKYSVPEALELVKNTTYSKFPGSVEVHLRLEGHKKGEAVRGILQLPNGSGKEVNAAILDDKMIEEILKNKRTEHDVLIATPEMMPKIARVAKILGPQGKMPSPKSGTVTKDPEKILAEIKKGRTEYKADSQGIVHVVIGKTNWEPKKLEENYKSLLNSLVGKKLSSITICATMGPGIKVSL